MPISDEAIIELQRELVEEALALGPLLVQEPNMAVTQLCRTVVIMATLINRVTTRIMATTKVDKQ